jgi:hypothetical protein
MLITMLLATLSLPAAPTMTMTMTMTYTSHAVKASHRPDAGDHPEVFTASEKAPTVETKRL